MVISIDEVSEVALLARLSLTEQEKELYASQLSRIIEHFNQLKDIDTTSVEPLAHALPVTNVLREDEVKPSLGREALLANAPDREGNFFKVPKIGE
ncbi:MAG: Asp-tRNA(Asn)/Glu-tRNA(Gln) amidotransferase subunit GatC [Candidatus Obscuribacterales bacterium]|nr:Asp-tRNA(Asn)/Glu-tRNA(Gln) amidotransferase subunit GatC [Candidatus Obscuribacterales bacterium]